jgi:hypothetical protein
MPPQELTRPLSIYSVGGMVLSRQGIITNFAFSTPTRSLATMSVILGSGVIKGGLDVHPTRVLLTV